MLIIPKKHHSDRLTMDGYNGHVSESPVWNIQEQALIHRHGYGQFTGQYGTSISQTCPSYWSQLRSNYPAHSADSYYSSFWLPTMDRSFGAEAMLTKSLLGQGGVTARPMEPASFPLPTLQDLCYFENKPERSSSSCAKGGKDRMHPFYRRQSLKPAEGMTRTRDKYRVVYTEKQRKGLEKEYETNKFLTSQRRSELSEDLSLSERQIKIWFQNRRAKERRDKRKSSDDSECDSETSASAGSSDIHQTANPSASSFVSPSCQYTRMQFPEVTQQETDDTRRSQCRFQHISNENGTVTDTGNTCSRTSFPQQITVSPSEVSAFIPELNISPLALNVNFDYVPRL